MWTSILVKIRNCARIIFVNTNKNNLKIQQKYMSCDSWYSSPTKNPLVPDTTAVILGKVKHTKEVIIFLRF